MRIKNWRLRLLHIAIQLLIIGYIVWGLLWGKSYQVTGASIGTSKIKVKGEAYLEDSSGLEVFDALDLVQPRDEIGATFITTNMFNTQNQSMTECEGRTECMTDADCADGRIDPYGIQTGICETNHCVIRAWCPLEEEPSPPVDIGLMNVENFTVFIRMNVKFPKFGVLRDNVPELQEGFNLWTVQDLVGLSG